MSFQKDIYDYFATAALGIEQILAQELAALGAQEIQVSKAGVRFRGPLELGYKACLWLRTANRVLLVLSRFPAPDSDSLYRGVRKIHWTDHLTYKDTLAVDFSASSSDIATRGVHTHFAALKVKDAIVDQFRVVTGDRPSIDTATPDVRINVYLTNGEATVCIDLSGDSLHLRGYRREGSAAPLKENLAAALLLQAGWNTDSVREQPDRAFLDPMCGSATLLIEAALIAANAAPGLMRRYYGFLGWQGHVPKLWQRIKEEAQSQHVTNAKKIPRIVGYDSDARAIRIAIANIERAGFTGIVHVEKCDLKMAELTSKKGLLVVNPPYGERLGEIETLKPLYKDLGDVFKQRFKGWEAYVFTGSRELAKSVGLKTTQKTVFYNGPIECRLLKYEIF